MKKILLVLTGILLISGNVFAARTTPYAVDIPESRAEIEVLTQSNSDMTTQNGELQAQIDTLQSEVVDMEALVREISITMTKVKKQAGELYSLFQSVNDAEMKSKLNAQITENRKQRYALERKTDELLNQIDSHNKQMELNARYISTNNLEMKRNTSRIDILEASIKFTEDEGLSLDSTVAQSQELQSEVDNLLSQNPASSSIQ